MYAFISYSSKNKEDAYALKALCEANGINVWMAPESIPTGKSYMTEIPPAIDSSSCFILLLTQESEASHYVQCEVNEATSSIPGRVIPISKGYMPTGALRFPLGVIQIKQVHQIDGGDADLLDTLRLIKETMMKETVISDRAPQSFDVTNIAVLNDGRYLYLGSGYSQFATIKTGYFLYNKERKSAYLTHLPDLRALGLVKINPELMISSRMNASPDCNYCLLYKDEKIWVADLLAQKWIIQGLRIKMDKGEYFLCYNYTWGSSDQLYLFGVKEYKNRMRVASVTELSLRTKKTKKTSLYDLGLYEMVGTRKLENTTWTFFTTEDNKLVSIDAENLMYQSNAEAILEQLKSRFPVTASENNCFSPDCQTFFALQNTGAVLFLNVYHVADQTLLLSLPAEEIGGFALLSDYKAIVYHRSKGAVFLHDFKAQAQNTMADAALFRKNDAFYHINPVSAAFDKTTCCSLFLAVDSEKKHFRLVAVDSNKNIIAVSKENQTPFAEYSSAHVKFLPSGCVSVFSVVPGDKEFREDGVNSYLYLAQFHRENGRLVFDEVNG